MLSAKRRVRALVNVVVMGVINTVYTFAATKAVIVIQRKDMDIQVKSPIWEALKNPKLWGAVLTITSLFGVTFFKNVDGDVLIGAIVTIVTILGGATAYENGKKHEAEATVRAAQNNAEARGLR